MFFEAEDNKIKELHGLIQNRRNELERSLHSEGYYCITGFGFHYWFPSLTEKIYPASFKSQEEYERAIYLDGAFNVWKIFAGK